jgi:GAF domain-containing protein
VAQDPVHDVAAALRANIDDLDPAHYDLTALLEHTIAAAQGVLRVSGAGLMLLDEEQELRYVGASDEGGRALEAAQLRRGAGPGFDSLTGNRPVRVSDITTDPSYRRLAEDLGRAGVRAVLAAPVCIGGQPVGVLNVYRTEACSWTMDEEAGAVAFAGLLATLLRSAVTSRRHDADIRHLRRLLDPFPDEQGE